MCTISCKVEDNIKKQSEEIFDALGLSMSAAINMFLRAAIRENGIPVSTKLDRSYEKLIETRIKEAEDPKNLSPVFDSIEAAKDWLNA